MDLNRILQVALQSGASDIHLKVGLPPMFRVNGAMYPLRNAPPLVDAEMAQLAQAIMSPSQKEKFRQQLDVDHSYAAEGMGRFRVNTFMQRGKIGMVFRVIPTHIKTLKELLVPDVIAKLTENHRGLILVTGATGSGKSTTLAAMLDHINSTRSQHIITVEDPVEFMIPDKRCIVNQREVGVDAISFSQALKAALRQDPDVILVGEMRDIETVEIALKAAETGHLVMSTLHTVDAPESINRVVSLFPAHQHGHVRMQLANLLKGVISQRLIPRADGKGRVPAVEVMVSTAQIRELIPQQVSSRQITDAIAKGHSSYGSQTFDQSLMGLVRANLVTYQEALAQSSNPEDFALRFRGIESSENSTAWSAFDKKSGDPNAPAPGGPPPDQNPPLELDNASRSRR
jgi:twitching motility protein PilT